MSPRPSRICSVIDCGRIHHAQGYCRHHYNEKVTKAKAQHPAFTSAKRPDEAPIPTPLAVVR